MGTQYHINTYSTYLSCRNLTRYMPYYVKQNLHHKDNQYIKCTCTWFRRGMRSRSMHKYFIRWRTVIVFLRYMFLISRQGLTHTYRVSRKVLYSNVYERTGFKRLHTFQNENQYLSYVRGYKHRTNITHKKIILIIPLFFMLVVTGNTQVMCIL